MVDSERPSLVSRYYASEKLVLLIALLLGFWHAFTLQGPVSLPVINVTLADSRHVPLAVTLLLVISITFLIIEWKQSDLAARSHTLARFRYALVLLFAFGALWLTIPTLTEHTQFAEVPRFWYVVYVLIGLSLGPFLSVIILASLMIRSREEARQLNLRRVPVASQSQYVAWTPVFLALFAVYFLTFRYAPKPMFFAGPALTTVALVLALIDNLGLVFPSRDKRGRKIGYRDKLVRLKEIHSRHDYAYQLSHYRPKIDTQAASSPRELQESIRKHFAVQVRGKVDLRTRTLDQFTIEIVPINIGASSHEPENVTVKIALPNGGDDGVRVQVWPKDQDPPRDVLNLRLTIEALERHAQEFLRGNAADRWLSVDIARYAINGAVDEILQKAKPPSLLDAVGAGMQEVVAERLATGENPNEQGAGGWSPLLLATAHGYAQIVEMLLKRGANPDVSNLRQITPLMFAARYGHLPIAKLLIDFGALVNLQDEYGDTALNVAVRYGHEPLVRLLLKNRADVAITNRQNETALQIAYKTGHGSIARMLRKTTK